MKFWIITVLGFAATQVAAIEIPLGSLGTLYIGDDDLLDGLSAIGLANKIRTKAVAGISKYMTNRKETKITQQITTTLEDFGGYDMCKEMLEINRHTPILPTFNSTGGYEPKTKLEKDMAWYYQKYHCDCVDLHLKHDIIPWVKMGTADLDDIEKYEKNKCNCPLAHNYYKVIAPKQWLRGGSAHIKSKFNEECVVNDMIKY